VDRREARRDRDRVVPGPQERDEDLGEAAGDTTGADVMKSLLRSRVREALLVAAAGVVLALAGLVIG